jgi:hypothetical protein
MSESFLLNPKHWRDRAAKTRARAEMSQRDDDQTKKLLRVAEEYDRLAERAERQQAQVGPASPPRMVKSIVGIV